MRLGIRDQRVLAAFAEKRPAEGLKLHTDGRTLDGYWLGGRGIAEWGSDNRIHMPNLGSRSTQSIQRQLRRHAAPVDFADYSGRLTTSYGSRPRRDARGRALAIRQAKAINRVMKGKHGTGKEWFKGVGTDAKKPTGLAASMYRMAENAAEERGSSGEVHVAWPKEKRAVEQLERAGLVTVRRTKDRIGGMTEWWYKLAPGAARDKRRRPSGSRDNGSRRSSRSSPQLARALRQVEEAWLRQYAYDGANADVYLANSDRIHAAMSRAFEAGATQADIDRAMDRALARRRVRGRAGARHTFARGARPSSSRIRQRRRS